MEIKNTDYYLRESKFLRLPPECNYAIFGESGFSYVNGGLRLALALSRESKSNYALTVIYAGDVVTVSHNNLAEACRAAQNVIFNARKSG